MWNLQLPLLAAILVSVFFGQTVSAQQISRSDNLTNNLKIRSLRQIKLPITHENSRIRQLSEIQPVLTSAQTLLVQSPTPASEIVQVTAVKVNPTNKGVEVILQTSKGQQLQLVNRTSGNNFIADIPNAQLRLPSGDAFSFRSDKPIAGVSKITVTNFDANTIRVTVTGQVSQPVVELFDSPDEGIIFSVASALSATPSPQQPQTQPTQTSQPENQTQPTQPSASSDQPIELVVTGEQDGYRATDSSTATKTDTPLRDIPASIQIVPRQVLEDQRAERLQDALENLGITQSTNFGGAALSQFIIRGFEQRGYFRNGSLDNYSVTPVDLANVERVEVLKGPASVLFGQGAPGGIINLITKQPLSEPYYAAEFTAGSYDFYRPTLDFSGPLNSDKTLLYRLNVAYQNAGSFRDFVDSERIFIAPSLTWKISANTKLNFDFEYLNLDAVFDRGIPALGNRPAPIPISRFLGFPQAYQHTTLYKGGYTLEHRFSDNWQLRNALFITSIKAGDRYANPSDSPLTDNRFLERDFTNDRFPTDNYNLQTEVTGKFATGSINHQSLIGLELNRNTGPYIVRSAELPPIDIFNPDYNTAIPTGLPIGFNTQFNTNSLGLYLQDQITLLDNLKLLVGGRFDFTGQENKNTLTGDNISQSDHAFSPRVGLVYQPIPPISLYASYSRSFVLNIGTSVDGSTFDPERGTQYEVGVKADLSNKVSATLAAYHITKSNVLTPDPNNPNFSIQVGEQRSQGIELNVAGEILSGLKIIGSYGYTDAEITRDNLFAVGNRLYNVPKNAASLWTTYEIPKGKLQGLGFGLGLYYVGDRQGDFENSVVLPSYFRTDAALYYKHNNWKAAINIKNLFDEKYYENAQSRNIIYPGAPLTVLGTISVEF
ncbi:MAG: TonB-dependent siderophore receptor [Nostoc sp.]|uniref:TonB-dependent siderophore receptor n=1 Tax=Nostoc sp. TaxID=1180 RepID=UPI002FF5EB64